MVVDSVVWLVATMAARKDASMVDCLVGRLVALFSRSKKVWKIGEKISGKFKRNDNEKNYFWLK